MRTKIPLLATPQFPQVGPARMVNGYIAYYTKSAHTVYEHDLVAEQMILGRRLLPDEEVHHRNHTRHDNRVDNLEVKSRSQHAREHMLEKYPNPMIHQQQVCKRCSIRFTAQQLQKYCSATCANLASRAIGRPTLVELHEFRKTMTKAQIASMCGVSETAVRKWLKKQD